MSVVNYWVIFLILASSHLTLAQENFEAKELRTLFEMAQEPLQKDLLKKTYTCEAYLVFPDQFNKIKRKMIDFKLIKKRLYLLSAKGSTSFEFKLMENNRDEILSATPSFNNSLFYYAIRSDQEGNLLTEWSSTDNPHNQSLSPVANLPRISSVISYGICKPRKKK